MNKTLLAIVISLVILVIVVLIYYFLVYLPSKSSVTSQAFTVSSVPPTTLSATVLPSTSPVKAMYGIPFYVHSGSALAKYAGMPLAVVQGPIFVGDSAWLILSTPTGEYIAEVMNVVEAEQIGVGSVIVSGSTIIPMVL
ncbi:MAG: hypothetical protein OWQ50_02785 [Acidianus infernus]|nr:hypothetical protein [Acidianus infernus]